LASWGDAMTVTVNIGNVALDMGAMSMTASHLSIVY
jgi:hypothetical protein